MAKKLGKKIDRKQQFGAGIDALFSGKASQKMQENPAELVKELSSHFAMIPLTDIERNPDQPRKEFDEGPLKELAASIKVHGIIQPLTVRRMAPHQYQIISGERRWRASQMAGLKEVPAYIRIANDQTLLEMALIENIQREDLNAFEVAVSYHRLKQECELTDEELAHRVGKQRPTITNYLRILELHPAALDAVKQDRIKMGHARVVAGIKDTLLQKQFLDEILQNKWSVRETETQGKAYTTPKKAKRKPKQGMSVEQQQMLDDFRAFFGSKKIKINMEDKEEGKGEIVIPFEDFDQLNDFFKCVEQ